VPLIVDNTVASPWLIRPLEWGADIVVHSATKFIGGHGTSIGGVIVDGGSFDFGPATSSQLHRARPQLPRPGLLAGARSGAYIIKARVQLLRDIGAAITPFNSFLFLQGLETLSLRMERHNANAPPWPSTSRPRQVESVQYAGLPSSPWHERASATPRAGATARCRRS
jgi:O-acetylhomoserine (thiol)-lyase